MCDSNNVVFKGVSFMTDTAKYECLDCGEVWNLPLDRAVEDEMELRNA
jgi:hypothetical protein